MRPCAGLKYVPFNTSSNRPDDNIPAVLNTVSIARYGFNVVKMRSRHLPRTCSLPHFARAGVWEGASVNVRSPFSVSNPRPVLGYCRQLLLPLLLDGLLSAPSNAARARWSEWSETLRMAQWFRLTLSGSNLRPPPLATLESPLLLARRAY